MTQVRELYGVPIDRVLAYQWRASKWTAVTIQIDERNRRGDYVLDGGQPFTKGTDDGQLDENDEVVVRVQDLGDNFGDAQLKRLNLGAPSRRWKLAVSRPKQTLGYLLIVESIVRVAQAGRGAVFFDAATKQLETLRYQYRFRSEQAALLGDVRVQHEGKWRSVFASSEFQLIMRLPWWLPNFSLTQDNFTSEIESWQNGPIRSIVAVGVKFRKFLALFNFHMFSELVFYESNFQIPTVIEFKFDPSRYLKPGSGLAYTIRFANDDDWAIQTNLVDLPTKEPESLTANDKTAADVLPLHARGKSRYESFLVRVRVDPDAARQVPPPYVIRGPIFGDQEHRKAWPWLAEMSGDLGIFIDFSSVRQGSYDFGLDLFLGSKADEGPPEVYDDMRTEWHLL